MVTTAATARTIMPPAQPSAAMPKGRARRVGWEVEVHNSHVPRSQLPAVVSRVQWE